MRQPGFRVILHENFSLSGDEVPSDEGHFQTFEAALDHCKALIDQDLDAMRRPDMSPQDLFECWVQFGDCPVIHPGDFSAEDYVRMRCRSLKPDGDQGKGAA
jgi:hypothetical protein